MRIDPKNTTVSPVTSVKGTAATAPVQSTEKGAATVVELSKAGAAASARVDASSGASPEKLHRLRALIDKGQYHPDLDQLAKRIVEDDFIGDGA
jgi:anti-sigma28 factor (negative regulator of flagellin synthesis)